MIQFIVILSFINDRKLLLNNIDTIDGSIPSSGGTETLLIKVSININELY